MALGQPNFISALFIKFQEFSRSRTKEFFKVFFRVKKKNTYNSRSFFRNSRNSANLVTIIGEITLALSENWLSSDDRILGQGR